MRAEAAVATVEAMVREGTATLVEALTCEGLFAELALLAPTDAAHDLLLARSLLAREPLDRGLADRLGDLSVATATMIEVLRLLRAGRHDEANRLRLGSPLT